MSPLPIGNAEVCEMSFMKKKPHRRLIDRFSGKPSILDAGVTLIGELTCKEDVFVEGSITGNGNVGGSLLLMESGHWKGDIQAANAVIAGQIEGNVQVTGNLEIHKTARVSGSVRAGAIAIALGAKLEGEMAAGGGTAIVHFEEKRENPTVPTRE